jgi:exopolysaccharide biosynthesis polyprenyl glycosylphosphotransferase
VAVVRTKDTMDALASGLAVVADAAAIFAGFLIATWIRFDTGLFPVESLPPSLYFMYGWGSALATIIFLFIFRTLGLYVRPQLGRFPSKIPRLIRATGLGLLLATALAFAVRTDPPFSRLTMAVSFFTIAFLVVLERYILFRVEIQMARKGGRQNRVLIVGTDAVATHLKRALAREPRLRSKVVGFVRTDGPEADESIDPASIKGHVRDLEAILDANPVDQLIVTDNLLGHQRVVEIILACEQNLISFNMVPDMFRIMTGSMDMQLVDDIPLLGVSRWPLDYFWNRLLKRMEDVVGSTIGLLLFGPVIFLAALLVKRSSPGPVFYRQERCGESGRPFTIFKLRTMNNDAESDSGPVWAEPNDPRRTRIGASLRRHNLDELPQLWNVLKGEMSLVGPRPERPHFVEKFKDDIDRYMWRHVSKPGMTGWAQVNGLRGNTSIEERIKYDLYYLENWSLSFDFKILLRTIAANRNAY